MHNWILLGSLLTTSFLASVDSKTIKKRQLFREEVLPHMGGKVPESAFHSERLALNQLNARGIYSSTGMYLEHRELKEHPEIAPIIGNRKTNTMQVRVPDDNRFVAPAGRYHYRTAATLDTTYVIREPVTHPFQVGRPSHFNQHTLPVVPYHSLKLAQYYRRNEHRPNYQWDAHKNDIDDFDDFSAHATKEYQPYLKKIIEAD